MKSKVILGARVKQADRIELLKLCNEFTNNLNFNDFNGVVNLQIANKNYVLQHIKELKNLLYFDPVLVSVHEKIKFLKRDIEFIKNTEKINIINKLYELIGGAAYEKIY